MGELVVSSEGKMELEVEETEVEKQSNKKDVSGGGGGATAASGGGVRWERFLPKMVVRVLLVEADDSTRQIIAALLRKCSYRVAAVADGLKAWELLKGSPCNIDLILTEVELPSISGYALLTLIMEHEICKNIPVIMMSSQDSVSTVYKCMLRGATDFLVKPLRKNELRNLWQHVWRKQASSTAAGLGPPDESVQEKDDTTGENNAISNHSSGYMSCVQRNRECTEKGSDAQSSCTKPESETEGEDTDKCLSQPKSADKCLSDNINISRQEERHQERRNQQAHDNETRETQAVAEDYAIGPNDESTHHVLENSLREAIDLIGAFDNHFRGTVASNVNANKFDIMPFLDLSLRRSNPSMNQVNDEKTSLNHSDASPFSRYINKPLLVHNPTSPIMSNQQKDQETNSEKQFSNYASDDHVPIATNQTGQPEITFSYSQNREISHPIPVRGVRYENSINTYNSAMPTLYRAQSGSSSLSSPHTPHHTEPFPQMNQLYPSDHQPSSSQQYHNLINNSNSQTENKHVEKSENMEDQGLISPGNDQSGNSSFCTGNKFHDKIYDVSALKATPSEYGNEESLNVHEGASQRSMQREAALNKFRMKRKDRCFEKKVRYESRKKLAEQRPRVKGQFVRQAPTDQLAG